MKKILILLLISYLAQAQTKSLTMQSNTEGFSIGLHGNYFSWASSYFTELSEVEPDGYGAGLELGYGFTQRIEVIARFDFSTLALKNEWDTFNFNNLDLLARFNLGSTTKKLRPYLEIGMGNKSMKISPLYFDNQEYECQLSGIGLAYGGGLNYFINRNFLISLNVAGDFGNMKNFNISGMSYTSDENVDISNLRIRLGARYYLKDI